MMTRIGVRMGRQMRSRWRNSILVACGVAWGLAWFAGLAAAPAGAQSAEVGKILSQYAKAEGGGGKLGKVVTLRLDGTVTEINGKPPANVSDAKNPLGAGNGSESSAGAATYTFETKLPNRYYSEMLAGDKGWIEAFNGKSPWRENARGEIGTLVGPEGLQVEAAARFYNTRLL